MATNDNPFTESNQLIAKLLKENNFYSDLIGGRVCDQKKFGRDNGV